MTGIHNLPAELDVAEGRVAVTVTLRDVVSTAPTATDAAVGHALAAAFGAGAQFLLLMLLDLLGHGPDT